MSLTEDTGSNNSESSSARNAQGVSLFQKCESLINDSKHTMLEPAVFVVYCENFHITDPDINDLESCEEAYSGEYSSARELAYEVLEADGTIDTLRHLNLANYVNYEAYGEDLLTGGDFWHSGDYYFRNL